MNVYVVGAGALVLVIGLGGLFGAIPIPGSSTGGAVATLCPNSVVNLSSLPCLTPPTLLSALSFAPTWGGIFLQGIPTSGYTTTTTGSVVYQYQLAPAGGGVYVPLTVETVSYCTLAAQQDASGNWLTCTPNVNVPVTDSFNGATDIGTMTSGPVSVAAGSVVDFKVTLTDQAGTTVGGTYAAQVTQKSYAYIVQVQDAGTQAPISGANVFLGTPATNVVSSSPNWYATGSTGTNGQYTFNVPFGAYPFVQVGAFGYVTQLNQQGFSLGSPSGSVLTVNLQPQTFTLYVTVGEITGTSGGAQCPANLQTSRPAGVNVTLSNGMKAVTNAQGLASFPGLPAGTYTGTVSAKGFQTVAIPPTDPSVSLGAFVTLNNSTPGGCNTNTTTTTTGTNTTIGNSASCTPTGRNAAVYVVVSDSNTGGPVKKAQVSEQGGTGGGIVYTDSGGTACINNIAVPNQIFSNAGTVSLTVVKPGYQTFTGQVTIKQGQTTSVPVQLNANPTFSLGNPVALVMVIGGAVTLAIGNRMKGKDGEA